MDNTTTAYAEIARTTGDTHFAPNGQGWVELVMPDDQPIYIEEVDEHTLEISARIVGAEARHAADLLQTILTWNTENLPMRIALEPGNGTMIGQRVDVRDMDARGLTDCIGRIVRASNDLADILATHRAPHQSAEMVYEDGVNLIRL